MNVLIVDDEPLAQDILETYIAKIPDLKLIQKCNNALEANNALKNNKIDIMFLDIQMPQLTGIEFLKTLQNPPKVIFTTAYSEYAVEGFELNAVDYLLKPISFERFFKAINKITEGHNGDSNEESAGGEDHIFVKADKKLIRVNYDEVVYIEGLKDYVIIRLDTTRVITLQTMKSLEDKLPSGKFIRIHRSYIVALDKINAIEGNMVEVMEKNQPKHLPIGKNYRDELMEKIEKFKL